MKLWMNRSVACTGVGSLRAAGTLTGTLTESNGVEGQGVGDTDDQLMCLVCGVRALTLEHLNYHLA